MITTLNRIEITKIDPVLIFIVIIATLAGVCSIILYKKNEDRFGFFYLILGTMCFGFAIVLSINCGNEEMKVGTGKYRIEATITDDMPLNSVYEQYEIIDKRGDIYLLEPKVFDFNKEIEK